jgi:hypothetical protein
MTKSLGMQTNELTETTLPSQTLFVVLNHRDERCGTYEFETFTAAESYAAECDRATGLPHYIETITHG